MHDRACFIHDIRQYRQLPPSQPTLLGFCSLGCIQITTLRSCRITWCRLIHVAMTNHLLANHRLRSFELCQCISHTHPAVIHCIYNTIQYNTIQCSFINRLDIAQDNNRLPRQIPREDPRTEVDAACRGAHRGSRPLFLVRMSVGDAHVYVYCT